MNDEDLPFYKDCMNEMLDFLINDEEMAERLLIFFQEHRAGRKDWLRSAFASAIEVL